MDAQKAQDIIRNLFDLIGVPVKGVVYVFDDKRGHCFKIDNPELETLLNDPEVLVRDINYLLKMIFSHQSKSGEVFRCTIDINGRQAKSDELVKRKALEIANEARGLKGDVLMDPMSSYERMIVHNTLGGLSDISTESVGEGKDRRVKVKYLAI